MNFENNKNKIEVQTKYTLPESNIIACGEDSEIRKKNREYFEGIKEVGFEWPVEWQGGGETSFEEREFIVHYPVGDIFLSSAVTMHELGHLRQGQIDKRFAVKIFGAQKDEISDDEFDHKASEEFAWENGLGRAKKYCPEILSELEKSFQNIKEEKGILNEFNSFEDFYQYIAKISLRLTEFNDKYEIPENDNTREKGKILSKMIMEDDLTRDFL